MTTSNSEIELVPAARPHELAAAGQAVRLAGLDVDAKPPAYANAWRAAALAEGVDRAPASPPWLDSPWNAHGR
jgi:hypothetical protein